MKTAIIILAILTVVFWIAFKLLYAAALANPIETIKSLYGFGTAFGTTFFSGLCRIFCWLCGAATIILLLIFLI